MAKSLALFLYACLGYAASAVSIAYLIGFIGGFPVPKGVNDGPVTPLPTAVMTNLALIAAFGSHHSATARLWFKRRWRTYLPEAAERPTYLLMSAGATLLLVALWRPIPITIWLIEAHFATIAITSAYLAVFAAMVWATFAVGHGEFFGVAQAWRRLLGRRAPTPSFVTRGLYAVARHPISMGWMLAPWLTPHMTVGQLLLALGFAAYVMLATPYEEADLIDVIGERYERYRERTPAFLPRLRRRRSRLSRRTDD